MKELIPTGSEIPAETPERTTKNTGLSEKLPDFAKNLNPRTDSKEKADQPINNRTDFLNRVEQSAELKDYLKENSLYSEEVNNCIRSAEELDLYKELDLKECKIGDRTALIRDIDPNYIDPDTGLSNAERMAKGKAPIDNISGETIELHHIGQGMDNPLAELTKSEHMANYGTLHKYNIESEILRSKFATERANYWKERTLTF